MSTSSSLSTPQTQLEAAIAVIRDRFLAGIDDQLLFLDDLLGRIEAGDQPEACLRKISDAAHKIRGVAATLGFATLGKFAELIELRSEATLRSPPNPQALSDLLPYLHAFLDHLDSLRTTSKA